MSTEQSATGPPYEFGPAQIDESTYRLVQIEIRAVPVMNVNTGQGGQFAPLAARLRFTRHGIGSESGWSIGVSVGGQRLRADGTIGRRRGGAVFSWPASRNGEPTRPSPPLTYWPGWLVELVDAHHPDGPVLSEPVPDAVDFPVSS